MNKTLLYISESNENFNKVEVAENTLSSIDLFNQINNVIKLDDESKSLSFYLKNIEEINDANRYVEVSENNLEIVIEFDNGDDDYVFETINEKILFFPFYIGDAEINNVLRYNNNSLLFVLNNPIEEKDNLSIYRLINITDTYSFFYDFIDDVEPVLTIKNHRKDNLQNYEERSSVVSRKKSYGQVKNENFDVIQSTNNLFDSDLNIDFEDFSNHVRYGSALSKVINFSEKIEKIKELDATIDGTSNNLNPYELYDGELTNDEINDINNRKIKEEKLSILESFLPFERWAYVNRYNQLNETEFNLWVSKQKEKATEFDGKNNELLLYQLPRYIVENDELGYLTNFIFMMGNFFDVLYMYANSLSFLNEYSINEKNKIPTFIIEDVFNQMGFSFDLNFSNEDLKKYFENEDNVKKVSDILSHRLIDSIPQLSKMKGTVQAIEYLFNIFGIPRGLFNIVEFSKKLQREEFNEFINEETEWFLNLKDGRFLRYAIRDSDMDVNNYTFELVIKNLQSNGTLFEFNADNYFSYTFDGENFTISATFGGSEVYSNVFKISNYSEAWTFISIKRTPSKIKVDVSQKIQNLDKLINKSFDTKSVPSSTMTFNYIEMRGELHITEFRLFDSFLDDVDTNIHMNDIRSVNESFESTLNVRYYFYNPLDLLEFDAIDGNEYNVVFSITVDVDDFERYAFKNVLYSNTIFSNDIHSDKIHLIDTKLSEEMDDIENPHILFDSNSYINVIEDRTLSSKIRKNSFIDSFEDTNTFGVYLSENDIINKEILRKKGIFNSVNPEWTPKYKYTFENFKRVEGINYRDMSDSIKTLYNLFNDKILSIINEFIPARTQVKNGVIIKNNILNKNKNIYESKLAKSLEYKLSPLELEKRLQQKAEYIGKYAEIKKLNPETSFENEIFQNKKTLNLVLKTERSRYLEPIETYENNWKSPFLRRVIRGRIEGSEILTAEQLREFLNYGAQILVL